MLSSLARQCCVEFERALRHLYVKEFIWTPTIEDLKAIMALHEHRHGVLGMFGSLDCMHTTWKNCPMSWKGSFQGKGKACLSIWYYLVSANLEWRHQVRGNLKLVDTIADPLHL